MTQWNGIKVGELYKMTYYEDPNTGALSRSDALALVVRIELRLDIGERADVTLLQDGKVMLTRSPGHIYDWDINECYFGNPADGRGGRYVAVSQ